MAHKISALVVWETNFLSCVQNITNVWSCCVTGRSEEGMSLTLNLLTWSRGWAPNHASKWQMGYNLAFKGLSTSAARAYGWTLFWLNLCSSNAHFILQKLRFIWIYFEMSTSQIVKILHVVCSYYSTLVPFHELCRPEYILSSTIDSFAFKIYIILMFSYSGL
jgi:hypothetical protein